MVGFAGRLRREVDTATVQIDLLGTVHDAIRPAQLGLWLRDSLQGVTSTPVRREP